MRRPSIDALPAPLARAARAVATELARAGHRAWLVGGAVRDLALGIEPHDADLASAATPDELARLFPRTHAVGRAFGTVVVHCEELTVEVTTFRAESGYDDARRPTRVSFSSTLEEDAARRDFTCNALYLDPLEDELRDPTGGLEDLRAGRLRCVGDPRERFAEDGLRLLRLARLAAQYGLALEPATVEGARDARAALRGVSAERVLAELKRMAEGAAPGRAAALLVSLGILERLPVLGALPDPARRAEAVARLPACSEARFLATLLGPGPVPEARLAPLRPSRALARQVVGILELAEELGRCLVELEEGEVRPSRWIRLARRPEYEDALACWEAWHPTERVRGRERLRALVADAPAANLHPQPLVTSAELARAGIPPGPRWKTLLDEAEALQLDGAWTDVAQARTWLEERTSGGGEDAS